MSRSLIVLHASPRVWLISWRTDGAEHISQQSHIWTHHAWASIFMPYHCCPDMHSMKVPDGQLYAMNVWAYLPAYVPQYAD